MDDVYELYRNENGRLKIVNKLTNTEMFVTFDKEDNKIYMKNNINEDTWTSVDTWSYFRDLHDRWRDLYKHFTRQEKLKQILGEN